MHHAKAVERKVCGWVHVYVRAFFGCTVTAEIAFIFDLILSVIPPQAQ